MAYITGTIGATANPAADLYAVLAPAFTTASWTLVDTVTISTRTHKVWKSAAANNTQGVDWWMDVAYTTTGAGSVWLLPMEFYDPATHLATRMVCTGISSTVIEQTFWAITTATGTLESGTWGANPATGTVLPVTTTTAGFGYWVSVTGDRVAAISSNLPSALVYAGMFTPNTLHTATAGAAVFPLVVASFDLVNTSMAAALSTTAAGTTRCGLTRLPKVPTAVLNWGQSVQAAPALGSTAVSNPSWFAPPPAHPNTAMIGSRVVCPLWVVAGATSNPTICFGPLGALIGVAYGSGGATVSRGDTVTIGADTWVATTSVSQGVLFVKAT